MRELWAEHRVWDKIEDHLALLGDSGFCFGRGQGGESRSMFSLAPSQGCGGFSELMYMKVHRMMPVTIHAVTTKELVQCS